VTARQISRREVLSQPPTMSLGTLALCLGKGEPTIRKAHRKGELAAVGIKVNKLGSTHVVVTASVWDYLGLLARADASVRPLRPTRDSGGAA
jgi:hypothetical protein